MNQVFCKSFQSREILLFNYKLRPLTHGLRVLFSGIVKFTPILIILLICQLAISQQAVFQMDFDDNSFEEKIISKDHAIYMVDLQQSQFAEGLSG